ncbi:uncharacterized protein [Haliotis cracherodii]|uniref:uncharacterized protein n=1 Tax=Haliotis cracherodii TaxID=6455 RepID=UPI0039E991EB
MKFAIYVVSVLLSSVTGRAWLTRRESDPGPDLSCLSTTCENVYAPVFRIMSRPTFSYLIKDGRLSLDCSQQTRTIADECQSSSVNCFASILLPDLAIALNLFCLHQTEIEEEASCWTSDNLPGAVVSCRYENRVAFAECVYHRVSSLTECTETTGAIFRQLLLAFGP